MILPLQHPTLLFTLRITCALSSPSPVILAVRWLPGVQRLRFRTILVPTRGCRSNFPMAPRKNAKIGAEVAESSKGTEAAKESATAMDPAPDNTEATYLQAQTPKGQLKDAPTTEGKDEGAQTHAHAKAHKKLEAYNNEIKNLEQQKQQLL